MKKTRIRRSTLPFSISLTYEIIREELEQFFKQKVMFINCSIDAGPMEKVTSNSKDYCQFEIDKSYKERYVTVNGIIVHKPNDKPAGDTSVDTKVVGGTLRLRQHPSTGFWSPHYAYIRMADTDHRYGDIFIRKAYYAGIIDGQTVEKCCDAPCKGLIEHQLYSTLLEDAIK